MTKSKFIKLIIVPIIMVLGIAGWYLLSNAEIEAQKRDIKPSVRTVKTETINFGKLNLEITGNGIVESKSILDVVSEVSGKIDYAKNSLKNGTFVKKGEIVVQIDSREIENNLYSLRSDFINAVATLLPDLKVESNELYDRWYKYFSLIDIHSNLPALPEVTTLQEKIKLSSRQIFTKYYAVKNQEILLSKYIITAPYDGFIKSNGVIEESFISRGQNLFTIEDVHHLEIAVPLLINEFNQIQFVNGADVIIGSDNTNKVLSGKLVRRDPILDRNSQSLKVYVAFSNYSMIPDFLSGNYVNVKIKGKKLENVAAIPRHLVDNENYVFTIADGKLAKEKLNVVEVQKEKVIVTNTSENSLEIVTTILQKPLIGMQIKSFNHVEANDSTDLSNDSVAVN